jgi:hypothetical protein
MRNHRQQYRWVTDNDVNGLAFGVVLYHRNVINKVVTVHPRDSQNGKVQLTERDITANLPYPDKIHLAFHHYSNGRSWRILKKTRRIIYTWAPSTECAIHNYYGAKEKTAILPECVVAVVYKANAANHTIEGILHSKGWIVS